MFKEFKEFAMKGSLIDTAIAFVMGAGFGKLTSAFVDGMFSPLVGLLLGGIDLSKKKTILTPAVAEVKNAAGAVTTEAVSEVAIQWGSFVTACIDFTVVALVMFMIVKAMNKMKAAAAAEEAAAPPPPPPAQEVLLSEIRDLLKR
jgi:large conductance mechanosensitive channel